MQTLKIDAEFKALIPAMSVDEYNGLEQSLLTEGCRDMLVVWGEILIDGHNRYEICQEYGIEFKTVGMDFKDRTEAKIWIIRNQFGRRNLSDYVRAQLALSLKSFFAEKAKENQATSSGGATPQLLQKSAEAVKPIDTRKEIAQIAGVSHDTIAKVERIERQATPELKQAITDKKVSISSAVLISEMPEIEQSEIIAKGEKEIIAKAKEIQAKKREVKRVEIIEKLENIETKKAKELSGVYDVIVIDPPWAMQKIERDERPNQSEFDYPTMSIEEIGNLKLPCADSCHVFLWTTHKFLPDAFELLNKWDLKYICCMVWHKPGGFQPYNLPQYNCEFVLYARKGNAQFIDTKAFPVCFNAPRGAHSEKPQEFYDIVNRVTAGRKLDMFNRREITGFDGWGNESNGN